MVDTDRGQVLLIGGLAIAIVFLTAIPLSNSLVVTESASTSETVSDIDRTAEREASVERGIRAVVQNSTNTETDIENSLKNFTANYTTVSAQRDGVYVDAELLTYSPGSVDIEITYVGPDTRYARTITVNPNP